MDGVKRIINLRGGIQKLPSLVQEKIYRLVNLPTHPLTPSTHFPQISAPTSSAASKQAPPLTSPLSITYTPHFHITNTTSHHPYSPSQKPTTSPPPSYLSSPKYHRRPPPHQPCTIPPASNTASCPSTPRRSSNTHSPPPRRTYHLTLKHLKHNPISFKPSS